MIISLLLELNDQFSINETISTIIIYSIVFFIIFKYFPQYLRYVIYVLGIDLFIGYNIYRTNKIHNNYKKEFLSFNKELTKTIPHKNYQNLNDEKNGNSFQIFLSQNTNEGNGKDAATEPNIKMVVNKEAEFPSRENTKENPQEFVSQEENKIIEN
jgi:hypothetical protein